MDPDFSGPEQPESEALLPVQSSRNTNPARRVSPRAAASESPSGNLSELNDLKIWRHFESTRESAIFHLGEYLDKRHAWIRMVRTGHLVPLHPCQSFCRTFL